MDSIQTTLAVMLGGVLALLGTLLANFLQYRAEIRNRRREILLQRLNEIRRYIQACLEFADLAYRPMILGSHLFRPEDTKDWILEITRELEQWRTLPVKGSARVLYTDDPDLLRVLRQIDGLTFQFYLNAKLAYESGKMADTDDKLEELKTTASKASSILDRLMTKA
jgi:hypothetical protein